MELRDYQRDCDMAIEDAFKRHQSAAVELATGLGKTVVGVHYAYRQPFRTIILVHRRELAGQWAKTIRRVTGESPEIEQGSLWANETEWGRSQIVIASKDSLHPKRLQGKNKWGRPRFTDVGLLITDESHHFGINNVSYRHIELYLRELNPGLKHLGMSATLKRHDKSAMSQVYETCCYQMGITEGVDQGWLVPAEVNCHTVTSMDFSEFKITSKGDFREDDVAKATEQNKALLEIASTATQQGADRLKTLVFMPSVNSAEEIARIFNNGHKIPAGWVCGDKKRCSDERRADAFDKFHSGEFNVLANVGVCTEGYDEVSIEHLVMGRMTASLSLYTQLMGRGVRPLEGVVDFPGSTAATRKAAIAASAKPHVRVTDLVDVSCRHRIITSADVLSGQIDANVLLRAKDRIKNGIGMTTVAEEVAKAQEEIDEEERLRKEQEERERREAAKKREEAEAKRRTSVWGKATYTTQTVDPFHGRSSYGGATPSRRISMLFGKYRGVPLDTVPTDYLLWFDRDCKCKTKWFVNAVKDEIKRRDRPMLSHTDAVRGPGAQSWRKPTATVKPHVDIDRINQMLLEI